MQYTNRYKYRATPVATKQNNLKLIVETVLAVGVLYAVGLIILA